MTRFSLLALLLGTTVFAQPPRPAVIAHRGASGYLPEHTIAAKAYAHALGADYIEQDLVLSKDDVPVVLHDIHLDTTTDVAKRFPDRKRADGRYYALDFTVAELKQLSVTERFNVKTGQQVYPRRFPLGRSTFQISTLEEELQLIEGLNRATGRKTGIYPELKQPAWHRGQGRDISRVVVPILNRHGYTTKADACYLQCFELSEVKRLREEIGWQGRLVMLIAGGRKGEDGTDYEELCTAAGLRALAKVADGIGPSVGRLVTWSAGNLTPKLTPLARLAQAEKLVLHPYTVRADDLPKDCPSLDALHAALFRDLKVEGVFTDFPDRTAAWLAANGMR
jgi:glycerophosphoryl diester phosphodiesterase